MQNDGNLVMYTWLRYPVWASNTWGKGKRLELLDDGNLVVRDGNSNILWATNSAQDMTGGKRSFLRPSTYLASGQALTSENGRFTAVMQTDGNFVLYDGQYPKWSMNTRGAGNYLIFQNNGNVMLTNEQQFEFWESNTRDQGATRFVLTNSGNLVLYDADMNTIWSTNLAKEKPVNGKNCT